MKLLWLIVAAVCIVAAVLAFRAEAYSAFGVLCWCAASALSQTGTIPPA